MNEKVPDVIKDLCNEVYGEFDEVYCSNCEAYTKQTCHYDNHERDSSGDIFTCHECGYVDFGSTGVYRKWNE